MVSESKIIKAIEKLALNYGQYIGGTVEAEIKQTWSWGLENYSDDEFAAAVRSIIEDVDIIKFPSLAMIKARMPKKVRPQPQGCGQCYKGMRSNSEARYERNGKPMRSNISYACPDCEAGQEMTKLPPWPCKGCPALDTRKEAMWELGVFIPICRGHEKKLPSEVQCRE
ncbi:MAG: hypothetical protein ACYSTI_10430 [Planctomycetota bacterium]|jgi:hypothetical protein